MRLGIHIATVGFVLAVVFTWAIVSAQETGQPAADLADESSDALSARIDKIVQAKLSEAWTGHNYQNYSAAQARQMRGELARVSFPAKDGTVAKRLKIADREFFVAIRGCSFSLLDDRVSGITRKASGKHPESIRKHPEASGSIKGVSDG
ncbi:MAG: hypothetical protein KDA89_18735, partial [Planctomycetaceae bacterium]|nr:hypothetical protein [Planctomycetaceae bacterium]